MRFDGFRFKRVEESDLFPGGVDYAVLGRMQSHADCISWFDIQPRPRDRKAGKVVLGPFLKQKPAKASTFLREFEQWARQHGFDVKDAPRDLAWFSAWRTDKDGRLALREVPVIIFPTRADMIRARDECSVELVMSS